MVESRSLPQFGRSIKGAIAGAGSWASRDQRSHVHVGLLTATVHDRQPGPVSHLRADGSNGTRLGMGIGALWNRIMANRYGSSGFVSAAGSHNGSSNILLVSPVSKFSASAKVASGRYGIRHVDRAGDVDAVSHSSMLMPLSLLIKLLPAAGIAGATLAFVEGSSSGAANFLLGAAGSGTFLAVIGFARWFIERRDKLRADAVAISRTDNQYTLERERLLDAQTATLMKQAEEFYGLRDREKQTVIELQKTTIQQREDTIRQQQMLITAQAAELQSLRKAGS